MRESVLSLCERLAWRCDSAIMMCEGIKKDIQEIEQLETENHKTIVGMIRNVDDRIKELSTDRR